MMFISVSKACCDIPAMAPTDPFQTITEVWCGRGEMTGQDRPPSPAGIYLCVARVLSWRDAPV